MNLRVIALGQDVYWLNAVHQAMTGWVCEVCTLKSLSGLPGSDSKTVLLLDASGQRDVEEAVAGLRARGWRYVVVVAADPSAKQAASVLRRHLGYDYWEKTYDEEEIRRRMNECFEEITTDLQPLIPKKHPTRE